MDDLSMDDLVGWESSCRSHGLSLILSALPHPSSLLSLCRSPLLLDFTSFPRTRNYPVCKIPRMMEDTVKLADDAATRLKDSRRVSFSKTISVQGDTGAEEIEKQVPSLSIVGNWRSYLSIFSLRMAAWPASRSHPFKFGQTYMSPFANENNNNDKTSTN